MTETNQWAVKYRPTNLDQFISDEQLKLQVRQFEKEPPIAIAISGETGNGKTTLARIVAGMMTSSPDDINEINAAVDTGIDNIRQLVKSASFRPKGRRRVIIIDEAHALSHQAVQALLKPMESDSKTTWIICTNKIYKIDATILSRCRKIVLTQPDIEMLDAYLQDVGKQERIFTYPVLKKMKAENKKDYSTFTAALRKKSIQTSDGSIRQSVANFQTFCSIVKGASDKSKKSDLLELLKQASESFSSDYASESSENIIRLIQSDPYAAAAALLDSRDQAIFNQIFSACRDSIRNDKRSPVASQVFMWCVDSMQWGAFSNQNPTLYLASRLATASFEEAQIKKSKKENK